MILVTGACGYIGLHVVRELQATREVVALDVRDPPTPDALRQATYVRADVRDPAAMEGVFASHPISGVIHLAGLKSVADSFRDPLSYFETNVRGSANVLSAMTKAGVKLLVFSSSAAVYGVPSRLPVGESAPIRPESPYGESKAMVERMLPWIELSGGPRFLSLRYFNAAGASADGDIGEMSLEVANLIPAVMRAARMIGPSVKVFGRDYATADGTAVRDFVHVEDLASAHVRALEYLEAGKPSTTLNLGTGVGRSVAEVIAEVERVSDCTVPTMEAPRREGDPPAVWADAGRAADVLGWKAQRGISEIIESEWRWYLRHFSGAESRSTSMSE